MRMPRVRFTVRRMMVAVAFCAVCLAVVILGERRRAAYSKQVVFHGTIWYHMEKRGSPADAQRQQYHLAMARKYRRATRWPWLPVWPDPPQPDDGFNLADFVRRSALVRPLTTPTPRLR